LKLSKIEDHPTDAFIQGKGNQLDSRMSYYIPHWQEQVELES